MECSIADSDSSGATTIKSWNGVVVVGVWETN